jgi:hypothetical protein
MRNFDNVTHGDFLTLIIGVMIMMVVFYFLKKAKR